MQKEIEIYASQLIDKDVVMEIRKFAQKQGNDKKTISLLYLFIKQIDQQN